MPAQISTSTPELRATIPVSTPTKDWNILTSDGNVLLDFALSPDGNQLAIYTNQAVYIYNIETSKETFIEKFTDISYRSYGVGAVAFSPDGSGIAVAGKLENQTLYIWDIKESKQTSIISGSINPQLITKIEFNPEGNRLLLRTTSLSYTRCEGAESNLTLIDFNSETTKYLFNTDGCMISPSGFRFTDFGEFIIFTGTMSPDYSRYFVNSYTGEVLSLELFNTEEDGTFYDISSNGKIAAIYDKQKQATVLIDLTNEEVLRVLPVNLSVKLIHDEKDFFVYDSTIEEWAFWKNGRQKCIYNGIQYRDILPHIVDNLRMSSNQEFFAVFTKNLELQVWSIPDCKIIKELSFDK